MFCRLERENRACFSSGWQRRRNGHDMLWHCTRGRCSLDVRVRCAGHMLETLTLFQTKICDWDLTCFRRDHTNWHLISDLNHPGNIALVLRLKHWRINRNSRCYTDVRLNSQNLYLISNQNGLKPVPSGTGRKCMVSIRNNPPPFPPQRDVVLSLLMQIKLQD